MKNKTFNTPSKLGDLKIVIFVVSLYTIFLKLCSIPFEKVDQLYSTNRVVNYYRNNPKKDYWILIGTILIISCILFRKFIFGKFVFIYDEHDVSQDNINGLYPYMYHIYKNKEGLSWWSFNSGLGNNMFPWIVTFFVSDPFLAIGSFFWNPIENGFIYSHILKLLCISVVFYKYILLLTQNRSAALLTSIILSFSGFLMLNGQQYYYVNKILLFIFLLYSLEIYVQKDKKTLLFLVLVLNLTDIYFFYQNSFFVLAYLIFKSIYNNEDFKTFFNRLYKILSLGILALLTSAVILFPYIYVLGSGPRVSTENIELGKMTFSMHPIQFYFDLIGRIFSNNLSGNGLNYFSDYLVIPEIYSGLLTLLLLPQLFVIKNIQHKKALFFLLLFSILTLVFPFFANLFTAFQAMYFRWTYAVIIFNLIILSFILNSILKEKVLNIKLLNLTFFFLIGLILFFYIYYRRHDGEWNWDKLKGTIYSVKNGAIKWVVIRTVIYLFIYLILIQLINKYKVTVGIVLLLIVSSELILENNSTFYNRKIVEKNHNPYNSKSLKVINYIKSIDKSKFYRIEKEYLSYGTGFVYNDALVHDYYGLKTYNTYNNKGYYSFCKSFNLIKKDHWANILPSWKLDLYKRYKLLSLFSVKYLLTDKKTSYPSFVLMDTKQGINIYKNLNVMPLGFTYSKIIKRIDFNKLSNSMKDSLALTHLIVDENSFSNLNVIDTNSISHDKFKIEHFKNSEIKGFINSKVKSVLFFSIPYDKGWEIKVNGKEVDYYKVNIGFIGLTINKGFSKIELRYTPPLMKLGAYISLSTFLGILIFYFVNNRKNKISNNSNN